MQTKKSIFAVSVMIIVVLTILPIPPVLAYEKEEVLLGSAVDPTTFEFGGHTIAEGFAAVISTDLPVPTKGATETKVGFAVASLGDPWTETPPGYYIQCTPYVKEAWLKVEGDSDYTVYTGSIFDNTGTGNASMAYLLLILNGLSYAFLAYDIYSLLREVYQEPPVEEWKRDGHWAKAIVRQDTEPFLPGVPRVDPNNPRLQTAGAYVLSYFNEEGPQTLTITAGAEIYLQYWDVTHNFIFHYHIGTYSVSFQGSVPVGVYDLEIRAKENSNPLIEGDVYIDDELVGYTCSDFDVGYGTHTIFVNDFWESGNTGYRYSFTNWEDGPTSNPRALTVVEDTTITAVFNKKWCPGDVNGDGKVDMVDISYVASLFGILRGHPNWDSTADLWYDHKIDMRDIAIAASNFGNVY